MLSPTREQWSPEQYERFRDERARRHRLLGRSRRPSRRGGANASLQWVPDHPTVQLAVQMPSNADHPSHLVAVEVAAEARFADAFAATGGPPRDPVVDNVLAPDVDAQLLWDLGYAEQHVRVQVYGPVLPDTASVVEWTRGSTLTRFYPFKRVLLWGRRAEG